MTQPTVQIPGIQSTLELSAHPAYAAYMGLREVVNGDAWIPYRLSGDPSKVVSLKSHRSLDKSYLVSAHKVGQNAFHTDVALFPLDGAWTLFRNPTGCICVKAVPIEGGEVKPFIITHVLKQGSGTFERIKEADLKGYRVEAVLPWGAGNLADSGFAVAVPEQLPTTDGIEILQIQDLQPDKLPSKPTGSKYPGVTKLGTPLPGYYDGAEIFTFGNERVKNVQLVDRFGTRFSLSTDGKAQVEPFSLALGSNGPLVAEIRLLREARNTDEQRSMNVVVQANRTCKYMDESGSIHFTHQGQAFSAFPSVLVPLPGTPCFTAICEPHPVEKLIALSLADLVWPAPEVAPEAQATTVKAEVVEPNTAVPITASSADQL